MRTLLEQDEPLTFASSAHPVSSPVQIPSRHEGVSPDNLRCRDCPHLPLPCALRPALPAWDVHRAKPLACKGREHNRAGSCVSDCLMMHQLKMPINWSQVWACWFIEGADWRGAYAACSFTPASSVFAERGITAPHSLRCPRSRPQPASTGCQDCWLCAVTERLRLVRLAFIVQLEEGVSADRLLCDSV